MNIEKYLNHIADEETRKIINKCIDKMEKTERKFISNKTDFYDPYICNCINDIAKFYEISVEFDGFFYEAERKRIIFSPLYLENKLEEVVCIEFNRKNLNIAHKDVLGALLNIGIKREKTGDIRISDECVQFAVAKELEQFIISNFVRLKNYKINCFVCDNNKPKKNIQKFEIKENSVGSLRCDSIVAVAYNISRSKSQNLIEKGYLKIDFRPINKFETCDYSNGREKIFSLRGYGRISIIDTGKRSKKNKFVIKIKKWID